MHLRSWNADELPLLIKPETEGKAGDITGTVLNTAKGTFGSLTLLYIPGSRKTVTLLNKPMGLNK